jgi:hypothetical protein
MKRLAEAMATHPAPAHTDRDQVMEAVYTLLECAQICQVCADACLYEDDDMVDCIQDNLDCAEICRAAATILSRPGHRSHATLAALLEACAVACRSCAAECDTHDHAHCHRCAEVCRDCEAACRRLERGLAA